MAGSGSVATAGGATTTSSAGMVGFSIGVGARIFAPERSRTLAIDGGGAGSEDGLSTMGSGAGSSAGTGLGAISSAAPGMGTAGVRSVIGSGAGVFFRNGLAIGFLATGSIAGNGVSTGLIGSGSGATAAGAVMVALRAIRGGSSTRSDLMRTPYKNSV